MHFFDYHLPEQLIAQHPAARRDDSRLLVVRRASGDIEHRVFRDLPDLLSPGDLLVLNDTRVLPARVVGTRDATGGKWEGLYLKQSPHGLWEMLAQTRGYAKEGEAFNVTGSPGLPPWAKKDGRSAASDVFAAERPPDLAQGGSPGISDLTPLIHAVESTRRWIEAARHEQPKYKQKLLDRCNEALARLEASS